MIWLILTAVVAFTVGAVMGGWVLGSWREQSVLERAEAIAGEEINRLNRLLETAGIYLNDQGQRMIEDDWLDQSGSWTGVRTDDSVRPPAGQIRSWMEPRHKK